jgi:4-hydroxybenzoate polyprenyltransferase
MHPFIGFEIGLILAFFERVFIELHGSSPPLFTYALQITTGVSVYALDRLEDVRLGDKTFSKHPELVQLVNEKGAMIQTIQSLCTIASASLLAYGGESAFIPLYLLLVYRYRDIKATIPLVKPVFIAAAFSLASVAIPCMIADRDASIFRDWQALLPVLLHMYASSNMNDLIDVDEDRASGIRTFPVVYGALASKVFSGVTAALALGIHVSHPGFGYDDALFQASSFAQVLPVLAQYPKRMGPSSGPKMPKMIIGNGLARNMNHGSLPKSFNAWIPRAGTVRPRLLL